MANDEQSEAASDDPVSQSTARRRDPRRLLALKLMALAFGLGFSWLMLEVLVLVAFGEQAKFPRHVVGTPWGLRHNEPNATYRHKSADVAIWFRINGQGMRADRDYAYEKPAGVKRVVSLGDSFTACYEVELEDCFSTVMERDLNAALNADQDDEVEVLNAGVSGFSNAEEVLYFERELIKYDPDVVVLSFFTNDLVDNERTGLLVLEGDELLLAKDDYIPAGRIGNLLNTNPFFNFLSGYSNAFVLLKERGTRILKQEMLRANQANVAEKQDEAPSDSAVAKAMTKADSAASDRSDRQRRLAAAILDRLYDFAHARGIPVVIQSIASGGYDSQYGPRPLKDVFPYEYFDLDRPGLAMFKSIDALRPYVGKEDLRFLRSHFHWTPFAQQLSGRELAKLIIENGYLD
jgi:hypothetical protein